MSIREDSATGRGAKGKKPVAIAAEAIVTEGKKPAARGERRAPVVKGLQKHRQQKRAAAAGRPIKVVEEEAPPIDLKDTVVTDRLIKTFRKVAAAQKKNQVQRPRVSYANFLAKPPANAKKYSIDLRVHTPGTIGYFTSGGVEPGPALVRLAKVKGLDVIGLTDFYNATYIDIVHESIPNPDIAIIPGVDLCCAVGSCREVYVTALFPETFRTADISRILADFNVPKAAYGRADYCLDVPFRQVLDVIEGAGGVAIPTQLDKTPYRQLAIPPLVEIYGMRAFDLVHPDNSEYFKERWPDGRFTFFSFSNSTALAQIGTRIAKVKMSSPTFAGIKQITQRRS
ncbi:MAG: hypothetical protein IT290_07140 [Deltaproteobacteria bacterium]|nr:hypothetical protein [Deltaproteobacteria bacterium]